MANQQLQAKAKELELFGYAVSHDLRAPLRAIHAYTRILAEEYQQKLDDHGQQILDTVCSETLRMGDLINDLLKMARIGRQSLQSVPIDMTLLVQGVHEQLQVGVADPQADVRLSQLPRASADPVLLREVWANLLENAFKFTRRRERASIQIDGWRRKGEVVYCVRDNGVGFDMRHANEIFGTFARLHRQEEFEGTGIGLALVQRIVRLHNGRTWAVSEVDRGASFYFSLPDESEECLQL